MEGKKERIIDGGLKAKTGSAAEKRERRALKSSWAKTEVNCDENGRSHDHNGA